MSKAKPLPEGFHTVTPHLVVDGAAKALDFYKRAFGAREVRRSVMPGSDKLIHAEIRIGDSPVLLCDEFPEFGPLRSPKALKGCTTTIHLFVEDVDAVYKAAVAAGATATAPPQEMFWGDRYGKVTDPFGHEWSIATHLKDMTVAEIEKAGEEMFAKMQTP